MYYVLTDIRYLLLAKTITCLTVYKIFTYLQTYNWNHFNNFGALAVISAMLTLDPVLRHIQVSIDSAAVRNQNMLGKRAFYDFIFFRIDCILSTSINNKAVGFLSNATLPYHIKNSTLRNINSAACCLLLLLLKKTWN